MTRSPDSPPARQESHAPTDGCPAGEIRGARSVLSDLASLSTGLGASMVLTLATTVLITHLLGPTKYSVLAYVSVISGLVFITTTSWTGTAVARYGREMLETRGNMRAVTWERAVIVAPLAALACALVVLLEDLGALPTELTWVIVAITIGTGMAKIVSEHAGNLLQANDRMKLLAATHAGTSFVTLLLVASLIAIGLVHSVIAIACAMMAAAWLSTLVVIPVWQVGVWPPERDLELRRRVLRLSIPLIAFAVSQYVIQAVDIFILGIYRSAADVGLYSVAYSGYTVLLQLCATATIVLSPLFVSVRFAEREDLIQRFYQRITPQATLLAAVCAGLGASAVGLVVPVVFGSKFAASATPLTLLIIPWLLCMAQSFVAPILVLHERARPIGAINIAGALVNVIGDLLLVGVFGVGIAGPAIATGVSLLVMTVAYFYFAAGSIGVRAGFPGLMLLPGLAGVAAALVLGDWAGLLVGAAATCAVAALLLVARRPFAQADAELIAELDIPAPAKRFVINAARWLT